MTDANGPGEDAEVERLLRAALHLRAEATPIRGDGLALIRERVAGRRRGLAWTPILAGAAAAAVIVGIAVVPRIVANPADDNAAAGGPTSSASAVMESTDLPSPTTASAEDLPLSASSTADLSAQVPTVTAVPTTPSEPDALPVSSKTPLVYPYPTSQALAEAVKAGSTNVDLSSPENVARAFVASAGSSGESYTTQPVRPSSDVVPASKGVLVTVLNANGLPVANVYLRAVVASGQTVWGVVGATRDGGDAADLTVDPPQPAGASYALSGRFVAPIAGGSTLTVAPSYGDAGATAAGQVLRNVTATGDRWSVTAGAVSTTPPSGVVVTVVVNGRIVALVATTIGG